MTTLIAWLGLLEGDKEVVDPEYDRHLVYMQSHGEDEKMLNVDMVKWHGMSRDHLITGIGFFHNRVGGEPFKVAGLNIEISIMGRSTARDETKEYRRPWWRALRRQKSVVMFREPDLMQIAEGCAEFRFIEEEE